MGRSRFGVVVGVLLACAVAAAPAAGSTWTGRQLDGEVAKASLFGASCPAVSLCVVVGGQNAVATSTDPAGPASAWSVAYVGAGAKPTLPKETFPGRQIRGVDCPGVGICVAVSYEGLVYTSGDPAAGAGAWAVADLGAGGPNPHFTGVSCPTATFCAAVAKGLVATSTAPGAGPTAWSLTALDPALELRGVACPSPSFCIAVGDEGAVLSSTDPSGGPAAWTLARLPGDPGERDLYGVACASASLCVTGDSLGRLLVATSPGGGADVWQAQQGGATVQVTGFDCPAASQCVAVDNNADVQATLAPTGVGSWSFVNVLPYPGVDETVANAMFGVSCATEELCAIAGNRGQIFTSGDAFAAPAPPPGKGGGATDKKRPRRPRTTIATAPPSHTEIERRRVKVRFRFFARNHVAVSGFLCKLDHGRQRPCGSPRSYWVGIGRHVFRVRAVGATGLAGPADTARFAVCHAAPGQRLCRGAFSR